MNMTNLLTKKNWFLILRLKTQKYFCFINKIEPVCGVYYKRREKKRFTQKFETSLVQKLRSKGFEISVGNGDVGKTHGLLFHSDTSFEIMSDMIGKCITLTMKEERAKHAIINVSCDNNCLIRVSVQKFKTKIVIDNQHQGRNLFG